ncbi:MAG: dienelactone hydrolase family protein [Alphaproteobacteria bacterium]|nr:dienelactone hydrolase family protein [Alphaproteobacteria bacterium]
MRTITRRDATAALLSSLLIVPAARQAQCQAVPEPPRRVSITLAGGSVSAGRLHLPTKTPAPGVLVVHDGFGAIPELDRIGELLAFDGFAAVIVDLFGGKTARDDAAAAALADALDGAMARVALGQWFDWLRSREFCNQRLGSIGFGVGASHSVPASAGARVSATCLYYGRVDDPAERLHDIDGKIIGHFAERDASITATTRLDLELRLKRTQRDFNFHVYPSGAGFANPRSANYDRGDAALAWNRTVALFKPACGLTPWAR